MAIANEILGALSDRGLLQQIGREIAAGMAAAGNAAAFSPSNVTAVERGVAGGRGDHSERRDAKDAIKGMQAQNKRVNQITKSFSSLHKELDKSEHSLGKARQVTDTFSKVFHKSWSDVMDQVSNSTATETALINNLNKALEEEITSIDDILKIRQRQQKLEKQILDTSTVTNRATVVEYNKLSKALSTSTEDLTTLGTVAEGVWNSSKRLIRGFFSTEAAVVNLGIAVVQLTNDFRAQLRFGSQMGIWTNQMEALTKGVDPAAFTEMMGQARQVSIAFGDVAQFSDLVGQEQKKYYRFIGDTTEATKFVTDSYKLLGESGIRPVAGAMDDLGSTFSFLNKAVGVTSDQFTGIMEGVLQETDIRERLRAAQDDERAAIVSGIAQQIKMNAAMGMTIEQAVEAAKALGRLSGETAKDRFKRAAQTSMMMGAMGIQGGGRAAELIRKGQRITSPEMKELQGYMSSVADEAVKSKRGQVGAEFMVDALMDKTGMGQYLGKDSAFVTTMTGALKPQPAQLKDLHTEAQRSSDFLEDLLFNVDRIRNFLVAGALGKIMVGAAQLVGAYVIGKAVVGAAGGGAGAMASAAGGAMKGAALTGVAAAAAAYGVYQAAQAITTGQSDVHDALTSTETGRSISDAIGSGIAHTLAFFGHDASQDAVRLADEQRTREESRTRQLEMVAKEGMTQTEIQTQLLAEQKRGNDIAELGLQQQAGSITTQQMTDRINGMTARSQNATLGN